MFRVWIRYLTTLALAALLASPAIYAHDLITPPWRGCSTGTFQEWRFDTGASPSAPEVFTNSLGTPSATITPGRYGSGWLYYLPGIGTQRGYWDMGKSGVIALTIPNVSTPPANSCAWVSVQTTYYKDINQAPVVTVPGATLMGSQTVPVETMGSNIGWYLDQSYWRMAPSPSSVTVNATSSESWGALVDQAVVDTAYVASMSSAAKARQLAENTAVELTGPIVTRRFDTYFYMEDPLRIGGIRVNCSAATLPAEGTTPTVLGKVVTVNGERVIDQALVVPGNSATIPRPLGMPNRSAFMGLRPLALLVRVWGRATVSSPGSTSFVINDGSEQPLRIELHGVAAPVNGHFVVLTGTLGQDSAGSIIRVNTSDSLQYNM